MLFNTRIPSFISYNETMAYVYKYTYSIHYTLNNNRIHTHTAVHSNPDIGAEIRIFPKRGSFCQMSMN